MRAVLIVAFCYDQKNNNLQVVGTQERKLIRSIRKIVSTVATRGGFVFHGVVFPERPGEGAALLQMRARKQSS